MQFLLIFQVKQSNMILLSTKGLGLSDKPINEPYTWDYMSTIVYEVVTRLNLKSVHLVVQDVAGPIGVDFAMKHPGMVNTITFVNTFLKTDSYSLPFPLSVFKDELLRGPAFELWSNSFTSPASYLLFKNAYSSAMSYSDFKANNYLLSRRGGKNSLFKILSNYETSSKYSAKLAEGIKTLSKNVTFQQITVSDDVIPQEHSKYISELLNIKPTNINSKHFISEDSPAAFVNQIINFIDELPSSQKQNKPKRV